MWNVPTNCTDKEVSQLNIIRDANWEIIHKIGKIDSEISIIFYSGGKNKHAPEKMMTVLSLCVCYEVRVGIRFHATLNRLEIEIHQQLLAVYGGPCMSIPTVRWWMKITKRRDAEYTMHHAVNSFLQKSGANFCLSFLYSCWRYECIYKYSITMHLTISLSLNVQIHGSTLPLDSLTLTRALLDVTPSDAKNIETYRYTSIG